MSEAIRKSFLQKACEYLLNKRCPQTPAQMPAA